MPDVESDPGITLIEDPGPSKRVPTLADDGGRQSLRQCEKRGEVINHAGRVRLTPLEITCGQNIFD